MSLSALNQLSARERQVLDGIIAGGRSKTIAHDLKLAVRTVEKYRRRAIAKLGARNSAEAVRIALEARA